MNNELELDPVIILKNTWNWDKKTIEWAIEKLKANKKADRPPTNPGSANNKPTK